MCEECFQSLILGHLERPSFGVKRQQMKNAGNHLHICRCWKMQEMEGAEYNRDGKMYGCVDKLIQWLL